MSRYKPAEWQLVPEHSNEVRFSCDLLRNGQPYAYLFYANLPQACERAVADAQRIVDEATLNTKPTSPWQYEGKPEAEKKKPRRRRSAASKREEARVERSKRSREGLIRALIALNEARRTRA